MREEHSPLLLSLSSSSAVQSVDSLPRALTIELSLFSMILQYIKNQIFKLPMPSIQYACCLLACCAALRGWLWGSIKSYHFTEWRGVSVLIIDIRIVGFVIGNLMRCSGGGDGGGGSFACSVVSSQ